MSKLYVVGTPIGNLGDFSPRAVETLEKVDFIAAEDTRVTLKLLNHFGIKKSMISYFEHNKKEHGELIVQRILAGENGAIVTDAGMPAISDPGEDLVRLCHDRGVEVESVPGPCAFSTALALSGFPSGRFTFEGFLSVNKPSRREHLLSLEKETRTMLFYEAPHKLGATLRDMNKIFGNREIAIVREITKIHEEVIRTTLDEAVEKYADGSIKGEIVLVIKGAESEKAEDKMTLDQAIECARHSVESGMSVSEAAKQAAKLSGYKKGDIYKALLD
ncbi:MAG: 16S rRNA (cytidine(1402)-2'-O)-methyltransferase [Acutalibacteraceae bacterium]|nr:16S rRNA (cytidine(1402)-2'-O)-methyltransferase [Acutalibacteraceae bacterium]